MLPTLAARTTARGTPMPLVLTPSHLSKLLSASSSSGNATRPPVLLDCSWHMPNSPRNANDEFAKGPRIPGAQRWNVDEVATKGDIVKNLPHMMPDSELFAKHAASKGIDPETHVVCYDTLGVFSSPRAAFTFMAFGHDKVSILNGGLPAWIEAGFEVKEGQPNVTNDASSAEYRASAAKLQEGWVRSFEEVRANSRMGGRSQTVLDARPKARYDGTAPEPRAGMPSGHIPNSFSLPFSAVLKTHTTKHPVAQKLALTYTTLPDQVELYRRLRTAPTNNVNSNTTTEASGWSSAAADGDPQPLLDFEKLRQSSSNGEPSVTMTCGSGMTAAVLWLAFRTLGIQGSIYDESWMGWATRANEGEVEVEKTKFDGQES